MQPSVKIVQAMREAQLFAPRNNTVRNTYNDIHVHSLLEGQRVIIDVVDKIAANLLPRHHRKLSRSLVTKETAINTRSDQRWSKIHGHISSGYLRA